MSEGISSDRRDVFLRFLLGGCSNMAVSACELVRDTLILKLNNECSFSTIEHPTHIKSISEIITNYKVPLIELSIRFPAQYIS